MAIELINKPPLTEEAIKGIRYREERVFAQMLLGLGKGRLKVYHEPCVMSGQFGGKNCNTIPDFLVISEDPITGKSKEIYIEVTGGFKVLVPDPPGDNVKLVDSSSKERQRAILESNGVTYKILFHPQLASIQKKHPEYKFFVQEPNSPQNGSNGENGNGNGHNKEAIKSSF